MVVSMSDSIKLEQWEKLRNRILLNRKKIKQNQIKMVLMYSKEEDVLRVFLVSLRCQIGDLLVQEFWSPDFFSGKSGDKRIWSFPNVFCKKAPFQASFEEKLKRAGVGYIFQEKNPSIFENFFLFESPHIWGTEVMRHTCSEVGAALYSLFFLKII